jgi:DNA-binding transcriptional MerR regulator
VDWDGEGYIEINAPHKGEMHSTLQVCKALGINRERLRDWMLQGHIKPTQTVEEHGSKAGFTDSDVVGIALFKKLVDLGFKRELIADLLKNYVGVGGGLLHLASYLVFRIEANEDGGRNIISRLFVGGEDKLTISLEPNSIKINEEPDVSSTHWEDFHTINLSKIQYEVLTALKKTG